MRSIMTTFITRHSGALSGLQTLSRAISTNRVPLSSQSLPHPPSPVARPGSHLNVGVSQRAPCDGKNPSGAPAGWPTPAGAGAVRTLEACVGRVLRELLSPPGGEHSRNLCYRRDPGEAQSKSRGTQVPGRAAVWARSLRAAWAFRCPVFPPAPPAPSGACSG